MGVHDGHRQRLIQRFLQEDIDSFPDHNVLELLLFFAIPRRDTNEIAHALLDAFGSLSAVFEASYEELQKVPGIGSNAAALIKLMPSVARIYASGRTRDVCIDSTDKAGAYLLPRYIGQTEEIMYVICLDSKCCVLSSRIVHRGSINAVEANMRNIVALALQNNAAGVLLSHNHPGGVALPSKEDINTTFRIRDTLAAVGVQLIDHVIVADGDYVSLADSGILHRPA